VNEKKTVVQAASIYSLVNEYPKAFSIYSNFDMQSSLN